MIDVMRTTLDIDDDVLQAAKELGVMRKKTAGQILSELARKALSPLGITTFATASLSSIACRARR